MGRLLSTALCLWLVPCFSNCVSSQSVYVDTDPWISKYPIAYTFNLCPFVQIPVYWTLIDTRLTLKKTSRATFLWSFLSCFFPPLYGFHLGGPLVSLGSNWPGTYLAFKKHFWNKILLSKPFTCMVFISILNNRDYILYMFNDCHQSLQEHKEQWKCDLLSCHNWC